MKAEETHSPSPWTRARSAIAQGVLAISGIGLSARSGRRLAAACATTGDAQLEDALLAARRQLRHQRERIGVPDDRAGKGARARLIAAVDHLQDAARQRSAETARLERTLVADAVREAPGVPATVLVGVALLSEGYLTYTALSEALPDQPVSLLLASLVAAPLAALLAHRGSTMARRMFWSGRIRWYDVVAVAACLLAPAILGAGIVASRLVNMPTGNQAAFAAALAVGVGLQACLLGVPAISGWLGADPCPGLSAARREEARITARLAYNVRRLQASLENEKRKQERLDAKLAEAMAALDYWVAVYRPSGKAASGRALSRTADQYSTTRPGADLGYAQ